MPWLLVLTGHQQPWYWLFEIGRSLSYMRKDFNYLCHVNVEQWHKMWIYYCSSEKFSIQNVWILRMISQHWFRIQIIMAWCCLVTCHHYLILIQWWAYEYWTNISCSEYPMTHSEAEALFALSCWNVLFGMNQTWISILYNVQRQFTEC